MVRTLLELGLMDVIKGFFMSEIGTLNGDKLQPNLPNGPWSAPEGCI